MCNIVISVNYSPKSTTKICTYVNIPIVRNTLYELFSMILGFNPNDKYVYIKYTTIFNRNFVSYLFALVYSFNIFSTEKQSCISCERKFLY